MAVVAARPAEAVIDAYHQVNTTPIGQDPTWTGGDPGWANVTSTGTNYTYVFDSWVLSARHLGVFSATFNTPSPNDCGGATNCTFAPIPNQSFIVPNPPSTDPDWPDPLSGESDLRLIRVKGVLDVPSLTIASQPPPLGAEVVFIGKGRNRAADQTHWQVNTSTWTWTEVTSGGNYHGYKAASGTAKRWGTNKIAEENEIFDENDLDLNGDFNLNGRDVIALITTFDQTGGTAHESQAVLGDSGNAVFYNRGTAQNPQWELTGIVNSAFVFENQLSTWAVFNNATAFSDLSIYRNEIYNIINSHREYSEIGDLNLDGQVIGDGSGPSTTDDVTAFINGWLYAQPAADITSWQNGDMNLDGKTSLSDFVLVRNALLTAGNGAGAAALTSMLGGSVTMPVPEPSSGALLVLAAVLLAAAKRRRQVGHV